MNWRGAELKFASGEDMAQSVTNPGILRTHLFSVHSLDFHPMVMFVITLETFTVY